MEYKKTLSELKNAVTQILLLFYSFIAALFTAPFIHLTFRDAHGIANNLVGFDPETNFLRVVYIVFVTVGLYRFLLWLIAHKHAFLVRLLIGLSIIGTLWLGRFMSAPIYMVDTFHFGEQLAPGLGYFADHKQLYTELFFLHGAGSDVGVPVLSFDLLGRSIGSFVVVGSFLHLLAAIVCMLILIVMMPSLFSFLIGATWLYLLVDQNIFFFRELCIWIALLCTCLLLTRHTSPQRQRLLYVSIGFLVVAELFISIERGVVLVCLAGMVGLVALLFRSDRDQNFHFAPAKWIQTLPVLAWLIGGVITGLLILWRVVGTAGLIAFGKMLLEIPVYNRLLFNYPFPAFSLQTALSNWLPVLILVLSGVMLIALIRRHHPTYPGVILFAAVLNLFALLVFRLGTGRPDVGHIAYASIPTYLAAIYTIALYVKEQGLAPKSTATQHVLRLWPVWFLVLIVVASQTLDFKKISQGPLYDAHSWTAFIHAPSLPDDAWFDPKSDMLKTRDYIIANSVETDPLFVYTSQPMYYYLIHRPNPTRFYMSWFADPAPYEQELLADLSKKPPKFIIYSDGSWMDAPDNISMKVRLSDTDSWIEKNYVDDRMIGKVRVLKQR